MGKTSSYMGFMRNLLLVVSLVQIVHGTTCYSRQISPTSYRVIDSATVESQRGCEVFCDSKTECTAFAFTPRGLHSWCALLNEAPTINTCMEPKEVFLKKTQGCLARDNITAEFGDDPCIDEVVPVRLQAAPICPQDDPSKKLIVRAIAANGARITLDNDMDNRVYPENGMFTFGFPFGGVYVPVVAAVCATAGGAKCGCAPSPLLPIAGAVPAVTEKVGPCPDTAPNLYFKSAKCTGGNCDKTRVWYKDQVAPMTVTCQAGVWMAWNYAGRADSLALSAFSCAP